MPSYRRALLSLLGSRNAYALVSFTLGGEALNLSANLVVGFAGLMAPLALVSLVRTRQHILQKAVAIGVMGGGAAMTFIE